MDKNMDFALELVRYLMSLGVISEINEDLATSAIHSQLDNRMTINSTIVTTDDQLKTLAICDILRQADPSKPIDIEQEWVVVSFKMRAAINRALNTAEQIDTSYRISADTLNMLKEAVS